MTSPTVAPETPAQYDARMKWWKEARFGMFIHWGLYAIPAGKWGDRTDHGEWIRETAQIPVGEYEKLLPKFNPVKFEADAWARMAKDAGMKYVVLTSKHHDGFALFDSKQTDWDVMSTPFRRDIVKELAEACRRHGVKLGLYHSIMDWHHPDYLPRRGWEVKQRPPTGAGMDRYVKYLRAQVTEILTNYGDVAVVWFDGEWEPTWDDHYGRPLYELCRKLQPKTIINNRVSNNRGGIIDNGINRVGDFSTPEQYIPDTGLAGNWETCMTMNDNWGWNAYNHNWKSSRQLIRNLIDTASKGGNYLLNIGPRPDGTFPPESVERLRSMGEWMHKNGESIYGTTASPFSNLTWGKCTRKGNRLYLHVFDTSKTQIDLPGLATEVKGAKLLGTVTLLAHMRSGPTASILLPRGLPESDSTVVEVELAGPAVVYNAPTIEASSSEFVSTASVEARPMKGVELRYTLDGDNPRPDSPLFTSPVRLNGDRTIKVSGFVGDKQVTPMTTRAFRKVTPWASTELSAPLPGLKLDEYAGNWEKVPDFASLTPRSSSLADAPMAAEAESVGRRYSGFILANEADVYRFALTADDGAKLWIDGNLVVDNDGLHAAETKSGTAPLAKGWHRIEVSWFNATGGRALSLKMAPAGTEPRPILPAMLAHRP